MNTKNFLKEEYSFSVACMTDMIVLLVDLTFGELYDAHICHSPAFGRNHEYV